MNFFGLLAVFALTFQMRYVALNVYQEFMLISPFRSASCLLARYARTAENETSILYIVLYSEGLKCAVCFLYVLAKHVQNAAILGKQKELLPVLIIPALLVGNSRFPIANCFLYAH
jgi:hypothetical protein